MRISRIANVTLSVKRRMELLKQLISSPGVMQEREQLLPLNLQATT